MTINYFGPGLIGNTYYKFVCISDYKCREIDDYQKFCIRLALLPTFRKVYFGRDNVPEKFKSQYKDEKTGKMVFSEFIEGYALDIADMDTGYMWYRSCYNYWAGPLSSEGRDVVFIWVLGGWWPYKSFGGFIS